MTRFGVALDKVDERIPGIDLPLMSVSQTLGVVRRSQLTDAPQRAESLDAYKVCRKGDIVFNKMKIRSGAMGVAPEDGLVTYHYEVMRPRMGMEARYLVHLMKSLWFTGELISRERGISAGGEHGGIRTTEVPFKVLRMIDVLLPELDEQRAIADYLDRETDRIDNLIEEQQRLVGLLAERRVSAIAAPFVGDARTMPLGVVLDALVDHRGKTPGKVGSPGDDFVDAGVPVVSAIHIKQGTVSWDERKRFVPYWMFDKWMPIRLQRGDVLLTSEAPLGSVAQVPNDEPLVLSQRLYALRGRAGTMNSTYLRYFLESDRGQSLLQDGASGSTVAGIRQSRLVQIPVPVPPIDEQARVVADLDEQTEGIDRLIAESERFIELSRERRAALITAAVTGQIDIRGESVS